MRACFFIILLSYFFLSCQTNQTKKNEQVIIPTKQVAEKKKDTGIIIYLTFDDGPYLTTPSIDSLLSSLRVKASFFIVGSQMGGTKKYDSTFLAIKNNHLFKLYNHTYSHAISKGRINRYYAHPDSVWSDITRNKDLLELYKRKKDLEESDAKSPQTINNNLFVGSTSELTKLIKQQNEQK